MDKNVENCKYAMPIIISNDYGEEVDVRFCTINRAVCGTVCDKFKNRYDDEGEKE